MTEPKMPQTPFERWLIEVLEGRHDYGGIEGALRAAWNLGEASAAEECARICDVTPPYPFRPSIEAAHAIRARFAGAEKK